MDEVDRRVAEMLQTRSDDVRANKTVHRDLTQGEDANADPEKRRDSLSRTPPTTNPKSGELHYDADTEARDVSAKLDEYAIDAYGENTAGEGLKDAVVLDLSGAWRITQRSAGEYLTAEENYIITVIQLMIQQHMWEPQFFNNTTVGVTNQWTDGYPTPAMNAMNTLGVTQQLPYGGQVAASWVTNWSQQLRQDVSGGYSQSSAVQLAANLPLLRNAGEIAQEPLIQAQRNLIYQARTFERFRRQLLVSIASDYFTLVQTQSLIANQSRSLAGLKNYQAATQARVDAGRLAAFNVSIAANDALSAQAQLASLREQYILQLDNFKVRLGLPVSTRLIIKPISLDVPVPNTTQAQASSAALEYRLDLQNTRDGVDDARRAVANAENGLLPDLNLVATANLPTNPRQTVGNLSLSPTDGTVTGSATLSLPLDRQNQRLALRQATINLTQQQRNLEISRSNIVVAVRGALRTIDLTAFQLKLAEMQVQINRRRLEEQLLKIDVVEPRDVVQSEDDLLTAENTRDQARTSLRNAVLNFLLQTDQLRVSRDGTFEPLPGMTMPSPTDVIQPGADDPAAMGNREDAKEAIKDAK